MHSATPPLPVFFGDIRVTLPYWSRMALQEDTQCWIWSGGTSPTGSPIHRRKSVWRHLFTMLCGDPVEYGRAVRAQCGNPLCVNPDHRVPPRERQPRFRCPTCNQVTDEDLAPTLRGLPARSERPHVAYPGIKEEIERSGSYRGSKYTLEDYERDGGPEKDTDTSEPKYLPTGVWAWDPEETDKLCVIDDETVMYLHAMGPTQKQEWMRLGLAGRKQVPLEDLSKYEQ